MRKKCEGEYHRRPEISVTQTRSSKCAPSSSSIRRTMYLRLPVIRQGHEARIALVAFAAAGAVIIWKLWTSLWQSAVRRPLRWAAAAVILVFAGMVISLYPYLVPYQFKLYELKNDLKFLQMAGTGLCVVLPVIVLYVLRGYRALEGKIQRAAIPGTSPALASRKTCGNNVDLHLS
jgi:cytochrome bd-type quinol oxidase subunit 2